MILCIQVEQVHRIFKLCGTPPDDYYKRMKLSTSLKPPQTYKSSLGETFRNFPSSSLGLLNILLALDPAHRGCASSALQNEVSVNFRTGKGKLHTRITAKFITSFMRLAFFQRRHVKLDMILEEGSVI